MIWNCFDYFNPSSRARSTKSNSEVLPELENAVIALNAYKYYGRKDDRVDCLVNFNMAVKKGTIYGLLGPSGAGKTTLLSCLVGRKALNQGHILVFGEKPGSKGLGVPGPRVGFMPQDLSLFEDFTMNDILLYFGWIYGMKKKQIFERSSFLVDLLNLPPESRVLNKLSGGQKRRVSFIVALMHDPELLILDEPTVGVDPLLRKVIWSHLVDLANNENKTIIITTHYIEEARQAHRIGLMRFGVILAEESPNNLLKIYRKSTLEDVFLLLSSEQSKDVPINPPELIPIEGMPMPQFQARKSWFFGGYPKRTHKMRALIFKNVMRIVRNPAVLLFFLALPFIQVIIFCLTIGREPDHFAMAVVNDEEKVFAPDRFPDCSKINMGELFLNTFDPGSSNLIYFADLKIAKDAVKAGKAWGVFYIPKGYTMALHSLMKFLISKNEPHSKIGLVHVWLDFSNYEMGHILSRRIVAAYTKFFRQFLKGCGKEIGDILWVFKEPIYGTDQASFRDFVAPGIILTIVFFLSVGQTAISLISEQKEGMLDRTLVAGVKLMEILVSHVIVQFLILICQTAMVLAFMFCIFGIPCEGDIITAVALTLLVGVCGMCYGFLISAACDNEITAIQISLGSFFPCLFISGIIWPIEGMPMVLRMLSYASPLTFGTTALRSIMSRGWPLLKFDVLMGFLMTLAWIILLLILSVTILHIKRG